ncbi:hypothetical protein [Microbispora sp. NBRC 16548]|uniref:hypothetical protein n=1 Tax=Microbispora sp. NBRC 16548 TaxID=3030994 RepID=UPI001607455B|nr:hypothetical protein [Microbispora sp. NBRC 16548]
MTRRDRPFTAVTGRLQAAVTCRPTAALSGRPWTRVPRLSPGRVRLRGSRR